MVVRSTHAHASAMITHDGAPEIARRYRYNCRCGKAGEWRATARQAQGDHTIHKHTADL